MKKVKAYAMVSKGSEEIRRLDLTGYQLFETREEGCAELITGGFCKREEINKIIPVTITEGHGEVKVVKSCKTCNFSEPGEGVSWYEFICTGARNTCTPEELKGWQPITEDTP